MNGWIAMSERAPETEDRYFVVYRTFNNRIEKAWVADYIESEGRWSSMPTGCEVIFWMPVPPWRCECHPKECGNG